MAFLVLMITLVDSNILIDVFIADPTYGITSAKKLRQAFNDGAVAACEIVWTDVGALFPNEHKFIQEMKILGIEFSPVSYETSLKAAEIWQKYRSKGGKKDRVVADFIIGAHALIQGDCLLTRDRGFYRNYFQGLSIIEP